MSGIARRSGAFGAAALLLAAAGCAGRGGGRIGVEGTARSSDGVEIHYVVAGEGEPALVFVHCWSCDRSYWEHQVSHFSRQVRTVAIDLAGHGDSGRNRADWTIEAFAEDVVAVVERLKLGRVILVGHSMGSSVVVEAARRIPDRVAAVVPVDSFHDVERVYTDREKNGLLDRLRSDFPAATADFVRNNLFSARTPPALADWIVNDMSSGPPEVGIGSMENLLDYRPAVALAQLQTPIFCINSDRYPTNDQAARKYIPRFQVHTIPGVGHFPMLEDPAAFNRILADIYLSVGG